MTNFILLKQFKTFSMKFNPNFYLLQSISLSLKFHLFLEVVLLFFYLYIFQKILSSHKLLGCRLNFNKVEELLINYDT